MRSYRTLSRSSIVVRLLISASVSCLSLLAESELGESIRRLVAIYCGCELGNSIKLQRDPNVSRLAELINLVRARWMDGNGRRLGAAHGAVCSACWKRAQISIVVRAGVQIWRPCLFSANPSELLSDATKTMPILKPQPASQT